MRTCDNCKHNNESITDERCYSCSVEDRQNWEADDVDHEKHWPCNSVDRDEWEIQDSGKRTQFKTGAVRDMHEGKGRFDLLPPHTLMRLARHFEEGAKKYGDRNWELGIPCSSFANSGMRHFTKYMAGETDEDHLISAIWNLICLSETETLRPEMQDIPTRMEGEK